MNTLPSRPIADIADDFCIFLNEDAAALASIVTQVNDERSGTADVMEDTLGVIRVMLSKGMAAGDMPYTSGEFHAWADQDPDSVLGRIRREWLALGHPPSILDIAWFGPGPERFRAGQNRASSRSASGP